MAVSRIFWFAHYNLDGPCVRYRGLYFLRHLEATEGIRFAFIVPGYAPRTILRFTAAWFTALLFCRNSDRIVFQKIHTRGIYATSLKVLLFFRRPHTVYDIDDAYHLKFPPSTIHHFLKRVARVVAGSRELSEWARKFNASVVTVPSPVIAHGVVKGPREAVLTVGWIGFYNAHRESLNTLFFPALAGIGIPVRLVLLGVNRPGHREEVRALFSHLPGIEIEMPDDTDWHDEPSVYRRICTFDVGIAPLLDTPYNRAKSAFKIKQCLSCGVPVLASPTGENAVVLKDGKSGLFCTGPEEFRHALLRFSTMEEGEYRAFSHAARSSAEQFSMKSYSQKFLVAMQ